MNTTETACLAPQVVLDTNAVLDWLVFGDAGMAAVVAAIESGTVGWIASPRMREELLRTLAYPALAPWAPDTSRALAAFDRWASVLPEPPPTRFGPLVCSDPDDQVFIDLALTHKARWLVTHDRALHKLGRRAALAGVTLVRPRDWAATPA